MKLSTFGQKFAASSGISELMDDLGTALNDNPDLLFMGGGNPGRIDAVQEVFAKRLTDMLENGDRRHELLGLYQAPQGDLAFRRELATHLRNTRGWELGPEHIAIANGSQRSSRSLEP